MRRVLSARVAVRPAALLAVVVALVAVGAVGVVAGVGVFTPAPAAAHNRLVSTSPESDAALQKPPGEIVLRYNQPVGKRFAQVAVTGPDGQAYVQGAPRVVGETVTQPLVPLGPEGEYVVGWRVVSADGHPISGSYSFWLGERGESRHDPGTTGEGSVLPLVLGIGGAVVALGLAAAIVLLVRRDRVRRDRSDDETQGEHEENRGEGEE